MQEEQPQSDSTLTSLSLAALGVVFGDIGTSPLYALRESLSGMFINESNVLGILSLIIWSLIIVISIKYCWIVFRADNDGEGGILALLALLRRCHTHAVSRYFFLIGIFGAGLMFGDGMLTPAISVLSAVEGIEVVWPEFSSWALYIACGILILLFLSQSMGTGRIGFLFGPIILVWFLVMGFLGLIQIALNPVVLNAFNPKYAIDFMLAHGVSGLSYMGGVFLVITGGEALFADLGHFGKNPIRLSWFIIVLPGLILNYLGQGAYLLTDPTGIVNPFYYSAPFEVGIPLLILATMATIIASQAVITATFSLTKQAVLLGLYPRLPILQTSEKQRGQIYIPQMNSILALGTLALMLHFQNSSALTHAYGIAVNTEMVFTSLLVIFVAKNKWRWNIFKIIPVFGIILLIDCLFLTGNLSKVASGGWIPIVFASIVAVVMLTWRQGMNLLRKNYYIKATELKKILKQLHYKSLTKLPGLTAIFITDVYDKTGGCFLHFLKLSRAVPENMLIVSYKVENIPYVVSTDRYEVNSLDKNICQVTLHYGFMDFISIPTALYIANELKLLPFPVHVDKSAYLVEIPNVIPTKKIHSMTFNWQEKLFAFLMRNYSANLNIEFYQLQYNNTMAIGTYYLI